MAEYQRFMEKVMCRMSKSGFRGLVLAYSFFLVLSFVPNHYYEDHVPEDVQKADQAAAGTKNPNPTGLQMLTRTPIMLATIGAIILTLTGLVGLFLLWSPGRHCFVIGSLGNQICLWFSYALDRPWRVSTVRGESIVGTRLILTGLLIAVVFLGSATHLFEKEKTI